MSYLGPAGCIATVVLLALGSGCGSDPQPKQDSAAVSSPPAKESCEAPSFKPTYFPWRDSVGKEHPSEELSDGKNHVSTWKDKQDDSRYVSLVVLYDSSMEDYGGQGFQTLNVGDGEGFLVWVGDPGVGELTAQWREGDGHCERFSLGLSSTGMSQEEAEKQMEKVAQSLQ